VVAHREGDVDLFWVEGYATGDERDLVESIGASCAPADSDL
jgi:hypothetical protein